MLSRAAGLAASGTGAGSGTRFAARHANASDAHAGREAGEVETNAVGPSASAIFLGTVRHNRLRPAEHALNYGVYSLLLDLDELPRLKLRSLSIDRFNLISVHRRDHADGSGRELRTWIDVLLAEAGFEPASRVLLLAMPRVLGHVFNPLSVYFCLDARGGVSAIVYEVNNTFGERHHYLIEVEPAQRASGRIDQRCSKVMHVSPFLERELVYRFRVEPPLAGRLAIGITVADDQGPVLVAGLEGYCLPLGDRALLTAFLTHPLLTLKVVAAIHWEALHLWRRGVPVIRKPAAPRETITIVKASRT